MGVTVRKHVKKAQGAGHRAQGSGLRAQGKRALDEDPLPGGGRGGFL